MQPLAQILDASKLEPFIINPKETPPEVRVRPVVGSEMEEVMTYDRFRAE